MKNITHTYTSDHMGRTDTGGQYTTQVVPESYVNIPVITPLTAI